MAKKKVTQIVEDILSAFLQENGYELYRTEFVKEGKDWFLRAFVDIAGGAADTSIGTDDCEKISRFLSSELDRIDPIEQNYYLEISSPGLDRELLRDEDFKKFSGQPAALSLYKACDGKKTIHGTLCGLEGDNITMIDEKGDNISVPRSQVAKARLEVIF